MDFKFVLMIVSILSTLKIIQNLISVISLVIKELLRKPFGLAMVNVKD